MEDILLANNYSGLVHETKQLLSKTFDMKDLEEALFVRIIEIHKDQSRIFLGLS